MRPATFLAALGLFLGAVSAAPQVDSTISVDADVSSACFSELECGILSYNIPDVTAPSPVVERELTNAARLARGLPLKAPHRRFNPSRVQRAAASPSVTARGHIRVDRADGTGSLGYLSKSMFSGAQYRYQSIDNALIVNFPVGVSPQSETQIDIATENSDVQSTYPRLSLVQGRDNTNSDLSTGSYQYAYIGGSDATASGATPQSAPNSYSAATSLSRSVESAVWSYDPSNDHLTPIWVNTDGSNAATNLFVQSTAIYAGGDAGAFQARYPSPVISIVFVFEPVGN